MGPETLLAIQQGVHVAGQVAKTAAKAVATGVKAGVKGGVSLHDKLEEIMPMEDPSAWEAGKEDFPPLEIKVSDNLGRKIKLLEYTAKALGTYEAFSITRGIIDQINDDSFKVLFVGKFATGKSALLNKLLEKNILKTDVGETTKTLTWLFHGEKDGETALYHDSSNAVQEIPLNEIVKIPDEPPVLNVYAFVNAEILSHGASLIDTPGMQASGESAALTEEALKIADAAILVVDHYPVGAQEKEFIEKLQKEGKADRLFVVVNKMDKVEADERTSLITKRRNLLSEMGVLTHIYALSNTNDLTAKDEGFDQFRKDLVEYIDTGLDKARDASVTQRIKNTAALLRKKCKEAAELGKIQDAQERESRKKNAREQIEQIEHDVKNMLDTNKGIIARKKQDVLDKWSNLFGGIKDEINVTITNATDAQLNNRSQLLSKVQTKINQFLLDEFQRAEDEVRVGIFESLNSAQLPMPQQEGRMEINITRWDKNIKVPKEAATIGLLAFTFFTKAHGFFSTIFCLPSLFLIWALSPFINKIFEQLLNTGFKVGTTAFKTKLQEEVKKQLPEVDDKVRLKIEEYFTALSDWTYRLGNETMYAQTGVLYSDIAMLEKFTDGEKVSELEKAEKELGDII